MKRGTYSQDKRKRESDKTRKKKAKAERRERRREKGSDSVEIVTADHVVGPITANPQAMSTMEENAEESLPSASMLYRLFVGNLCEDTTETELRALFAEHGNIVDAEILYDHTSDQSRRTGFVTFADCGERERVAEQLDGCEVDGCKIVVYVVRE